MGFSPSIDFSDRQDKSDWNLAAVDKCLMKWVTQGRDRLWYRYSGDIRTGGGYLWNIFIFKMRNSSAPPTQFNSNIYLEWWQSPWCKSSVVVASCLISQTLAGLLTHQVSWPTQILRGGHLDRRKGKKSFLLQPASCTLLDFDPGRTRLAASDNPYWMDQKLFLKDVTFLGIWEVHKNIFQYLFLFILWVLFTISMHWIHIALSCLILTRGRTT